MIFETPSDVKKKIEKAKVILKNPKKYPDWKVKNARKIVILGKLL